MKTRSLARLIHRWWHSNEELKLDKVRVDHFLGHYVDDVRVDEVTISPERVVAVFHPSQEHVRAQREVKGWLGARRPENVMDVCDVRESILQTLYVAIHATTGLPLFRRLEPPTLDKVEGPTDVHEDHRIYITVDVSAIHAMYSVEPTATSRERYYQGFVVDVATATMGKQQVGEIVNADFRVQAPEEPRKRKRKRKRKRGKT